MAGSNHAVEYRLEHCGHSKLNLGFALRKLEKPLEGIEERSKHDPNCVLTGSLNYFFENSAK